MMLLDFMLSLSVRNQYLLFSMLAKSTF